MKLSRHLSRHGVAISLTDEHRHEDRHGVYVDNRAEVTNEVGQEVQVEPELDNGDKRTTGKQRTVEVEQDSIFM